MSYFILNTDQIVSVMVGYVNVIHLDDPERITGTDDRNGLRIIVSLRERFYVDAARHCA